MKKLLENMTYKRTVEVTCERRKNMKNFKKWIMGVTAVAGLTVGSQVCRDSVYANQVDIVPPKGALSIVGATYKDGVFYTDAVNVTLSIEALDEVTATENIMMMLSDTAITGTIAVDDEKWEPYAMTKPWTLKNTTSENLIYLYLKDEANNISPNIVLDTASTFTITYAGEGENMPAAKTAQYGMLFNVAIQEPTLEGKYFLGWSETLGGSVQWLSDSVMEAKYIKGDKTLYAVWADVPPTLAAQVEIGDYVNYPVPYDNVYSYNSGYKSSYTGWRVLDIDGDNVTLVSAGTPLQYYHGANSAQSIENLTINLLSGDEYTDGEFVFDNHGFTSNKLTTVFGNEFTESVSSMTKADVDKILGETSVSGTSLVKCGSLLHNNTYYWLATAYNSTHVWNVYGNSGTVRGYNGNISFGVRPKVSLISGIKTSGRNVSGVWELEMP